MSSNQLFYAVTGLISLLFLAVGVGLGVTSSPDNTFKLDLPVIRPALEVISLTNPPNTKHGIIACYKYVDTQQTENILVISLIEACGKKLVKDMLKFEISSCLYGEKRVEFIVSCQE